MCVRSSDDVSSGSPPCLRGVRTSVGHDKGRSRCSRCQPPAPPSPEQRVHLPAPRRPAGAGELYSPRSAMRPSRRRCFTGDRRRRAVATRRELRELRELSLCTFALFPPWPLSTARSCQLRARHWHPAPQPSRAGRLAHRLLSPPPRRSTPYIPISGLIWFLFKCVSEKLPSCLREELHRGVGEMGIARGGSRMSMAQLFTKDG